LESNPDGVGNAFAAIMHVDADHQIRAEILDELALLDSQLIQLSCTL
jgi:hypothetical protein